MIICTKRKLSEIIRPSPNSALLCYWQKTTTRTPRYKAVESQVRKFSWEVQKDRVPKNAPLEGPGWIRMFLSSACALIAFWSHALQIWMGTKFAKHLCSLVRRGMFLSDFRPDAYVLRPRVLRRPILLLETLATGGRWTQTMVHAEWFLRVLYSSLVWRFFAFIRRESCKGWRPQAIDTRAHAQTDRWPWQLHESFSAWHWRGRKQVLKVRATGQVHLRML